MKVVAFENPTATPPIQIIRKKKNAQRNDVIPRAMEGIRRCIAAVILTSSGRRTARDQRNSPSRWRFRPPNLVTFRFRVQSPGSDSTYSRSVLGARGTVEAGAGERKVRPRLLAAICEDFFIRSTR